MRDVALAVAGGLVPPVAAIVAYRLALAAPSGEPADPSNLALSLVAAIGGVYLSLLLAIDLVIVRWRGVRWRQIGFRPAAPGWYAAAGAILVLWWAVSMLVYQAFGLWEHAVSFQRRALMPTDAGLPLLALTALAIGPLAALLEEALFRGLFFQWLRQRLTLASAGLLSAVLFSLVHLYFLVPGGTVGWMMTGEILAIGLALAVMFEKCGSLWPGTVLHAVNNLAMLALLVAG